MRSSVRSIGVEVSSAQMPDAMNKRSTGPARLFDGNAVAAQIREDLKPRIDAFTSRRGRPPGLGIVLVGDHPTSEVYVRNKQRTGQSIGMFVDLVRMPTSAPVEELLDVIARLNASAIHDGILVQTPLPFGGEANRRVLEAVDARKDVDGFHPLNVGRLSQNRPTLVACTPSGVIELLDRSKIPIAGTHAVVLGRSDIVGKPMALLLLHRDATVTVCHSKTKNLREVTASADILVAAIGRPAFVTPEFVKPGAVVIDVGINRLGDAATVATVFPPGSPRRLDFERKGSILIGDVHPGVAEVAGALTPVPGGVGPLTVAMVASNTIKAAEAQEEAAARS